MVKIGIVGSRRRDDITDFTKIETAFMNLRDELGAFTDDFHIISGGCSSGGDRFAERLAKDIQATITIYHAKWNRLGKQAGVIRNKRIAEESDYLIAAPAPDRTGGTEYTINFFLQTPNKKNLILV